METKKAEKWIMRKLNMAWKSYKNKLKSTYYDPYPSDAISIQKITDKKDGDPRVDLDQWKWLLEYWGSKKGQVYSKTKLIYF